MVKHVKWLVLVMSAASLFIACGGQNHESGSGDQQAMAIKALSQAPVVQCSDAATIAAGGYHTVGLKSDGTVTAVGLSGSGLNVSTWTNVKGVAAGTYHTVGLKSDGTFTAVGLNRYGELNVSNWTNIKAIAASAFHTIGLKSDGTVTAVGQNSASGELNVSNWTNITAIASGTYHTVGLKSDGTVTAVGFNYYSQLKVSSWTDIKAVAAGLYHTVGLKSDGTVTAIGDNSKHQCDVSTWTNIKAIAASWNHTVGLKEDGTVVAVGENSGEPIVSTWTNIKAIAAGTYDTVGLKDDGTVKAAVINDPLYDKGQGNVTSWSNIMPVCDSACVNLDAIAPVSTATVTGTLGNNGWYVSDVQATLAATDNDGGSGVKEMHYTVDGTETVVEGSSASLSVVGDGTHTVTWYAIDNLGNVETPAKEMGIKIDKTPPSVSSPNSTAMVSGKLGNNGWYVSDVPMALTATDNNGGSGVKEMHYTVDGTETIAAGSSATLSVVGDGLHTVKWWAIDNAGNVETPAKEMSIKIDKTPPSITSLSADPSILWPPNHKMIGVRIGGSADDNISEVASTTITVTDEYGVYNTTVTGFGSVVPLEASRNGTDKDGRLYRITAVATDKAGNPSTPRTITVLVRHDMRLKGD